MDGLKEDWFPPVEVYTIFQLKRSFSCQHSCLVPGRNKLRPYIYVLKSPNLIKSINCLKLAGQVTCKECWIGDLSGYAFHQGIRQIDYAYDVHLCTQPFVYVYTIA